MAEGVETKLKVGLIMPAAQVVTEPLFYEVAGSQFEFFTTRLYLRGSDVESLLEMEKLLPRAVEVLASAKVDIIVYCCTASGAILGNEEEIHKCDHFSRETNIPMATTMIGVVDALPDEKTRNQVLAENPQKLFGF